MKAARLHEFDGQLSVEDVPDPEIRGPRDVIVRVGGAGLCRTDLHLIEGWFKDIIPAERPFTLGHENAGWVEAVGDAVTAVKAGDGVIVHPLITCGICAACRAGEDMYCTASAFPGVNTDGGFADYLGTSERTLIKLGEEIHPASVAPYADAGITAYRAARKAAEVLAPGQTVVVIGVGGLGHIGVQLLRHLTAARIIAVDRSQAALDLAGSIGADELAGTEAPVESVLEATGGLGADAVVDFVGEGDTPAQSVAMLRQGGTYLVVGYGGTLNIPLVELILKEATIVGNLVGNYGELSDLMALVAQGKVKLHTRQYPLENIGEAIDDLRAGRIMGRGVIVPSSR